MTERVVAVALQPGSTGGTASERGDSRFSVPTTTNTAASERREPLRSQRCESRRISGSIASVRFAIVATRAMYDNSNRNGSNVTVIAPTSTHRKVGRASVVPVNVSAPTNASIEMATSSDGTER